MGLTKMMQLKACTAAAALVLLGAAPAHAASERALVAMINGYRAAPGSCAGRPAQKLAPLQAEAVLARVQIRRGTILEASLDAVGYPADRAEAISLSGPPDTEAAMAMLAPRYCVTLLDPQFSAIGVSRSGDAWQIVLARPLRPISLAGWHEEGQVILAAVNAVRSTPRSCGETQFGAAPPLAWNEMLGQAAQAHSGDMARHKYFKHLDQEGRDVAYRAEQAGYRWSRIAENIAFGFNTADEAVASWLSSPGHCANIMNPSLTEMGAAYDINFARKPGTVYWTQVFGVPR